MALFEGGLNGRGSKKRANFITQNLFNCSMQTGIHSGHDIGFRFGGGGYRRDLLALFQHQRHEKRVADRPATFIPS